jgi:hypothetical protein
MHYFGTSNTTSICKSSKISHLHTTFDSSPCFHPMIQWMSVYIDTTNSLASFINAMFLWHHKEQLPRCQPHTRLLLGVGDTPVHVSRPFIHTYMVPLKQLRWNEYSVPGSSRILTEADMSRDSMCLCAFPFLTPEDWGEKPSALCLQDESV